MTPAPPTSSPRRIARLALIVLAAVAFAPAPEAAAKLKGKEWKEAEARFRQLFAQRGLPEEKVAALETIASDESARAWRVMAEGLFLEVQRWWDIQNELVTLGKEHAEILQRSQKGYTPDDENRIQDLQEGMKRLEGELEVERRALDGVVAVVVQGPEALRKNVIKRAKSGGEWPYRAAAVRVAVACMNEKGSWSYLQNAIENDKDPRVRLAGLDAIAKAEEKWEGIVLGRLGDPHWSVVLRAARIIEERELHRAVPHLINALPQATPRLAEGIGATLRALTKENFEPFFDVWTKWWQDHQKDFEEDVKVKKGKQAEFGSVHFYGVPIKSDRVLFIIDISGSMKLPTKNENPKEKWKPPPTITGRQPPPPPPPEEILSGPKIDVAKHELKKALKKLPKDWTFNIIAFNTGAVSWRPEMVKATKKNKESAYAWMRALKPRGSTYIDGALRMGFGIAGLINYDTHYPDIHVDTIVLLSDGAPTDNKLPVSNLMDPELILGHVREWNKDKAVIVNCIGVDLVENIDFLKRLAEENGGVYVDR